jgi:tyrosinase
MLFGTISGYGSRPERDIEVDATPQLRVRPSIQQLQDKYDKGNKQPLEDLWRAWQAISELPANDPHSFFALGGYHGEPFRGPGQSDPQYWGGYCHHGNVLFPTWHRIYLLKLEDALRSVPGCENVTLPYWDETSADSIANGVPWALTQQNVKLGGKSIPNPLHSFIFTAAINDTVAGDDSIYSKPKGYETVRYPLSGLEGTPDARNKSNAHNAQYTYDQAVAALNKNITDWLTGRIVIAGKPAFRGQVADMCKACLDAPNYTVFSNTTSAAQWNKTHPDTVVFSVEAPHNSIHLAVGGFDLPRHDESPIRDANGDMGENDTAGFDPIFFFHHCYIDRQFWLWQKNHNATNQLDIITGDPGTDPWAGPGPPADTDPNTPLDLNTPLQPFTKSNGQPYTSADCINIQTQLGYTYSPGSLEPQPPIATPHTRTPERVIVVSGNRAQIHGSFLISAFDNNAEQRVHLGTQAILSRWNVQSCPNCQTHLDVDAFIPVPATPPTAAATAEALVDPAAYGVEIRTHHRVIPASPSAPPGVAALDITEEQEPLFRFEVR